MTGYLTSLTAIVTREALRFIHQRERFVAALVRPLVWLLVLPAALTLLLTGVVSAWINARSVTPLRPRPRLLPIRQSTLLLFSSTALRLLRSALSVVPSIASMLKTLVSILSTSLPRPPEEQET